MLGCACVSMFYTDIRMVYAFLYNLGIFYVVVISGFFFFCSKIKKTTTLILQIMEL